MKKTTLKLSAFVMLMAGVTTIASAQTAVNDISVVTTAVPFLRISPDARSGGMGDVGIATSADAYSGFWNLGKATFAKSNTTIGATYTPWLTDLGLNDVYLASLSGYHKLDENQALTLGLRYFSLGSIQFTDANGNQLTTFAQENLLLRPATHVNFLKSLELALVFAISVQILLVVQLTESLTRKEHLLQVTSIIFTTV